MTECTKKKLCTYQEERPFYSASGTHSEALVTYKNYVIFACSGCGGWKHNLNMLGNSPEPQKEKFLDIFWIFCDVKKCIFHADVMQS